MPLGYSAYGHFLFSPHWHSASARGASSGLHLQVSDLSWSLPASLVFSRQWPSIGGMRCIFCLRLMCSQQVPGAHRMPKLAQPDAHQRAFARMSGAGSFDARCASAFNVAQWPRRVVKRPSTGDRERSAATGRSRHVVRWCTGSLAADRCSAARVRFEVNVDHHLGRQRFEFAL
jgi:hypothetical protein